MKKNLQMKVDGAEVSWFAPLCDGDDDFLGNRNPEFKSSWENTSKIIKTACLKTKYFFCLVGRDFGTLVRVEDLVCVRQRLSAAVARERHQDRDRQSGEGRCQYTNVHWRLRGERVVLCDWEFILECNLQRGVKLFQLS